MLQDKATIETKYKLFIERTAASKVVWGLQNKEGWANSQSNNDEDIVVIPFWSDRVYAKACVRDEWKSYLPVDIPLQEFLESWCVGMAEEGSLIGTNWDANMFGKEEDALNVAIDILKRLNSTQSAISFLNFDSIDDFITKIIQTNN